MLVSTAFMQLISRQIGFCGIDRMFIAELVKLLKEFRFLVGVNWLNDKSHTCPIRQRDRRVGFEYVAIKSGGHNLAHVCSPITPYAAHCHYSLPNYSPHVFASSRRYSSASSSSGASTPFSRPARSHLASSKSSSKLS